MRLLRALVIGCALLAAGAANAERVFDLEIETRFNSSGVRGSQTVSGVLTLNDDRTYVLDWNGEIYGGVWLQERNNLQLLDESESTIAEGIALVEQDASDFAGFPVELTSIKYREVAKFNRNGDLKLRSKELDTFRPGLKGNGPLRMLWSTKIIGILREMQSG
jgi:hypothetical protein